MCEWQIVSQEWQSNKCARLAGLKFKKRVGCDKNYQGDVEELKLTVDEKLLTQETVCVLT